MLPASKRVSQVAAHARGQQLFEKQLEECESALATEAASVISMKRELEETDRTKTPWVVTAAHRPMYCSPNDDKDECHQAVVGPWHRHSFIRKGVLGK